MNRKITILLFSLMFLTISATAQNQLKSGEWQLVSMIDEKGAEISLPQKYKISIEFTGSSVAVRSCNSMSGKYSAGKKTIKITKIITTLKACHEPEKEQAFSNLLKMANTYSIKKGELILSGKNSKSVLTFKKKTDEKSVSLDGKWQLVSMILEGNTPTRLPEKVITLNIDKNKIGGNGGCNSYGGSFSQNGNKIEFFDIFSTKMWCDNSPIENQYFSTLQKATNFEIDNDQLVLQDAKKQNMLVFIKN